MNEIFQNNLSLSEIESERATIISFLDEASSNREKIIKLSYFFDKIICSNNSNILDAFLPEFIEQYIGCISHYEPFYIAPSNTIKVLNVAQRLVEIKANYINFTLIDEQIKRISQRFEKLINNLNGTSQNRIREFSFPVLESNNNDAGKFLFGFFESISIQIRKSKSETKFLVIPSESHLEKKIDKQIRDSWLNATNYLINNKINVVHKHHEVLIAFDRKEGVVVGNSLGVLLTIAFIEELLNFYNAGLIVEAKNNIVITGGMNENGKIISTSSEIIRIKTETVFYSSSQIFCVPKENEVDAEEKLSELKKEYPKRNLEIVGLTSISDLLNRRNIVEIKKQKFVVKSGKFIKKNWISAVTTVLLAILFGYMFVMDFDDNPAMAYFESNNIFITNKNSKKLFSFPFKLQFREKEEINKYLRIIDINGDGKNEILFVESLESAKMYELKVNSLSCYDKDKKLLWNYNFNEVVSSDREVMIPDYGISLVDIIVENGNKVLVAYACNSVSFASAVFKLDLLKHKKNSDSFWCAGHIGQAILADINKDGKKVFIGWGKDNGFEQLVLWAMSVDSLKGARPTTKEYQIHNQPLSNLIFYIRTPTTDYDHFANFRGGIYDRVGLYFNEQDNTINFQTVYDHAQINSALIYRLNLKTLDINIFICDEYRMIRDSLVSKGKLHLPYTDTKEYIDNLKNQILYWKDGKWVKREELDL